MKSIEFLERIFKEARARLPGWVYAGLVDATRELSADLGSDIISKLALVEIKPSSLDKVSNDDLGAIWLRLHQWYANAKRSGRAVEDIVNAALWARAELEKRGLDWTPSELTEEVDRLSKLRKARKESVEGVPGEVPSFVGRMLEGCPEEVLLVRDWVSVVGSAAVAEKPGDVDVCIRSEYDPRRGAYMLDGSSLWVALRRFMSPKKDEPQISLLANAAGSFTDYIPVFDLVVRKREPRVVKIEPDPPAYEKQGRVIKAASQSDIADAERAKKENVLTLGKYFFQPKPTRPAFPEEKQTIGGLIRLFEERADDWLPTWIQKKYDGANHQIHKDGDDVLILSEDGDDNSDRFPGLTKAVREIPSPRVVLVAEVERWKGDQHLPREAVAGYLASRDPADDSGLVANVYDVLLWDGEDIHSRPLSERLDFLKKLGSGTMGVPDLSKRINVAPGIEARTEREVLAATERIRRLPGSEGIVAKRLASPYTLGAETSDDWIKFHNATTIQGLVIKGYKTKGGVFTYDYGVKPGDEKPRFRTPGFVVPVGESFSTARKFRPGDRILIEAESVNKLKGPEGVELSAWVPRVLGTYEGDPDTVDDVVKRAAENLVLQVKRIDEKGNAVEYYPPNVIKTLKVEVPTVGPDNAIVAFVGASPGRTEVARGEPFVGPAGETFNELYLKPLGLQRSDVMITNAVPKLLEDPATGKVREPRIEELKEYRDWLSGELEKKKPRIVVALGRTAESAVGNADFVLPHPSAVRRFGDSGEVSRKLKQLAAKIKAVKKQLPEPLLGPREDETRGEAAFQNWEENWDRMLPKSGKGRFVYQHHWRGLSEDEAKLDESALMKTDHSIHGDIRLEGNGALWGWAVLLGRSQDNRNLPDQDKLIDWKAGDNIELAPKLDQPEAWLDVGDRKPLVSGPGEVGATSQKFSKFFEKDKGTYSLGVARLHMVEIFLDGKALKGRYLFTFAPVAGRRRWLIEKPEDQTPMAETRDLADVISELRSKKQRFLYWGKPGETPIKIDVRTGRAVEKSEVQIKIQKSDEEKRIIYGVVMDPYNHDGPKEDAHLDWTPPGTIEDTSHDYMIRSRAVGFQHRAKADAAVVENWIEQYPTREDYLAAMKGLPHRAYRRKFGDEEIHSGAWLLGVKLGPELWEAFKRGEINNFSPGGVGVRSPINRAMMPEVKFIDLVERPEA